MSDNPDADGFEDLSALAARLGELEALFGPAARPIVQRVRADLFEALAARERGDPTATADHMRRAMDELVRLFGAVDPDEAGAMRVLVGGFQRALQRREADAAARIAEEMRRRSGAVERPKIPGRDEGED